MRKVFVIYTEDGEFLDRGGAEDIAKKYNLSRTRVYSIANSGNSIQAKDGKCYLLSDNTKNCSLQYVLRWKEKIVFHGTLDECADYLGTRGIDIEICRKTNKYCLGHRVSRGYFKSEDKPKPINKTLAYLMRHLNEYGNTCLGYMAESQVKRYIDDLKKRGIMATYKGMKDPVDKRIWWLIEKMS